MPHPFVVILGKSVRYAMRLRGGGSALPGLFVEKISPDFIKQTLAQLPQGVVIISGTNGKTTTTKMVVELLESQGLKVFTNRTGSNFSRGVAAALLGDIDIRGKLHADIAVLEMDEAHAVKFVQTIPPRYSLLLNVMRDQLDRFGEIDATAKMLEKIAQATTDTVVLNREDSRVLAIKDKLGDQKVTYFGLSSDLLSHFPADDDLHSTKIKRSTKRPDANVILKSYSGSQATYTIDGKDTSLDLKLRGVYNVFNSAAALSLVYAILGKELDTTTLLAAMSNVTPAFGRGEQLEVGGQPLELVLVKNPSGFRLSLDSFPSEGYATMIAINDNYADGRDMSWLWDVDFTSLSGGVAAISGVRAYDMALRLQYDEVPIGTIEPELALALRDFIEANKDLPKRIYCTYTAMLTLRRELSKMTKVESIS
ncbi:MAG: MurT ligase domain-containing protein [Candidatus Microsaccharimonas sp.]|jgi:UDP-N-acetylmuramyl tripeptide synthase